MSFGQAIGSAFRNYAVFSGRSCRSEYWYFLLFGVVCYACLLVLDSALFPLRKPEPLSLVFWIATFLPGYAVSARRLHDYGRSGWWLLLSAPAIVVSIIFYFPESADPDIEIVVTGAFLLALIPVILLLVWAARKGVDGDNRFGPDPLGEVGTEVLNS